VAGDADWYRFLALLVEVGALAVGVTLLSAVFSACHVVTIRRAMMRLTELSAEAQANGGCGLREDEREDVALLSVEKKEPSQLPEQQQQQQHQHKIPSGKVPELLMFKMGLSLIFLIPAAWLEHANLTGEDGEGVTAWTVLAASSAETGGNELLDGYFTRSCIVPLLCMGVLTTMCFQGMMLAMATRIRALSIGFVAQCKVLPDYAASLLAGGHVLAVCGCSPDKDSALSCPRYRQADDLTSSLFQLHVAGAVLVLGGALAFARLRLREGEGRVAGSGSGRP
jgi:hypothetical protein